MTFAERLAHAREQAGLTQTQLARQLGLTPQAVQKWEAGGGHPAPSRLPALAQALGVSVDLLLGHKTSAPTASNDAIHVPLLANAASMGYGAEAASEDVISDSIALTPQFIHDHIRPTRPSALRFIPAYGDSMEPTFRSGDVLLIDTGVREIRIDGIYVLRAHDRLFVKRVRQRLDGSYEVSSDNPTHKTVDVLNGEHQLDILGRVVWAWNGRRI